MRLPPTQFTLAELAALLNATLHGNPDQVISGVAALAEAHSHQISFLDNPKYQAQLGQTQAGAVILAEKDLVFCKTAALVVDNPYLMYAKVAQLFWYRPAPYPGIHPTAIIDETAKLEAGVSIGPYAVIGRHVVLAKDVRVGAHCVVGDYCELGEKTELAAHVILYHQVKLGERCMIHSGTVLGSDGFGFAPGSQGYQKIPQLGGVTIGHDVEIGANTTVDRGALNDTLIADGVKLDNQIQVGHNVKIGANTVIAGCTGIAGSTEIGSNCMIGGAVGIAGHIKITDQVMLAGMAMVTHSINTPGVYASGTGLLPRADWQKAVVRFRQLNELAKTVQQLREQSNQEE